MRTNTYVYPYSHNSAKKDGELEQYQKSYELNVACAITIEKTIDQNYDGSHLKKESAKEVIAEYGFDRVNHVLSNSIQRLVKDGRFSRENKDWAKNTHVPVDKVGSIDRRNDFVVASHPAVLDGFVNQAKREYESLELWERKHCNDPDHLDFEGKIMVLYPSNLKDEYKNPQVQLVYTKSGFGCSPTATGRKVSGIFIFDGEDCQHIRNDFIGELKEEYHSPWLKERLEVLGIEYVSLETKETQLLELITDSFSQQESEDFDAVIYERCDLTTAVEINLALSVKQCGYTIYRDVEDCSEVGERYVTEEYPTLEKIICDNLDFDGIGTSLEEQGGKFINSLFVVDHDKELDILYKPSEIDILLKEYESHQPLQQGQCPTM